VAPQPRDGAGIEVARGAKQLLRLPSGLFEVEHDDLLSADLTSAASGG
jgi:hypothetical protein